MKLIRIISKLVCILFPCCIAAQTLKGRVVDATNGEALYNVVVGEKGTANGTLTDFDGTFTLELSGLPALLVVNSIGFAEQEMNVTSVDKLIEIKLVVAETFTPEVEIISDRILLKQKQNPLTVENMDAIAVKEVPTGNFYEGLAALKGVDMASASLAFRVINTRGFNSTSPVRVLQLIDGVDNQSPGLNFSLGNFLGACDLDVKNVEIVQGASSAFFGPGAFNGVINMQTKNPFFTPGLSANLKVGERGLVQPCIRWADFALNNDSLPWFAYKLNLLYLTAEDWHADNYQPIHGGLNGASNYGGYDAVNVYGDEYYGAFDYSTTSAYSTTYRGLGTFYRKGYKEEDLVNYDTENLRASGALHFRLDPKLDYESPELILQTNMGNGSTMYQGDNRFRLENIFFIQHRLELTKKDNYFVRLYMTSEDAGKSYDPYFTALRLRDAARSQEEWASVYIKYWQQKVIPKMNAAGYPNLLINPDWPGPVADPDYSEFFLPYDYDSLDSWYNHYNDSMFVWHNMVQNLTNTGNAGIPTIDSIGYLVPGTDAFNENFNRITSSKNNEGDGGTRFFDRSRLYHVQAEYKWRLLNLDELRVGANARLYKPNSDGTIFQDADIMNIYNYTDTIFTIDSLTLDTTYSYINYSDTTYTKNPISNFEFGFYVGAEKKLMEDMLILNATVRVDKNQNYDALLSPALSAVFMPVKDHYLRISLSSALRNPTLTDQYLSLNVGPATLRGNLDGVDSLITFQSFYHFRETQDKDTIEYFNIAPIRPEQARSIEVGYRAMLGGKLYFDASFYNTWYQHFIGYKFGIAAEFDTLGNLYYGSVKAYRYSANSTNLVITRGANVGLSWYFHKKHTLTFNYSYNELVKTDEDDPIIPAFNTPLHKFNVGMNARELWPDSKGNTWGYAFNFKWVDQYFWEGSPQFTGPVPEFSILDAQVNYTLKKQNINIKLGCSNLLRNLHIEAYGGPKIGRMAYLSLQYEWEKK
ncbi:MAG: carboxypeptidase-like regulatory domain-containing protein [Flavobacteriales bacterium]